MRSEKAFEWQFHEAYTRRVASDDALRTSPNGKRGGERRRPVRVGDLTSTML